MDTHINKKCKSAFFYLHNIRRIRKFLSFDNTQTLVNAFVTSCLDYCNSAILYGQSATELQKLQRVQNTAARLICKITRFNHISRILRRLHWLPIKYCIEFKILLTTYKVTQGLAPPYVSERITHKTAYLRSSSEFFLQPPRKKLYVHLMIVVLPQLRHRYGINYLMQSALQIVYSLLKDFLKVTY